MANTNKNAKNSHGKSFTNSWVNPETAKQAGGNVKRLSNGKDKPFTKYEDNEQKIYKVEVVVKKVRLVCTMAGYITYARMAELNRKNLGAICLFTKDFAMMEKKRLEGKHGKYSAQFMLNRVQF